MQENTLSSNDFILPIFLIDGKNKRETVETMPGVYRYTINRLAQIIDRAVKKGIPMVALFPKTKKNLKNDIVKSENELNELIANFSKLELENSKIEAKLTSSMILVQELKNSEIINKNSLK